jgi:hypothetical protein
MRPPQVALRGDRVGSRRAGREPVDAPTKQVSAAALGLSPEESEDAYHRAQQITGTPANWGKLSARGRVAYHPVCDCTTDEKPTSAPSTKGHSSTVPHLRRANRLCAVRAAVELAATLHTVSDDFATAVLAHRRHSVNRTFKTVEHVHGALGMNLKRHVVVVPADLALRHDVPPAVNLGCDARDSRTPNGQTRDP